MGTGERPSVPTVLIDDVRRFKDDRPALVARTSAEGLVLLRSLRDARIEELWLDHDLSGDDDIWPVVHALDDASLAGQPYDVGLIRIHAARTGPAHRMGVSLRRAGYRTERVSDTRAFTW